jgi:hypothetical protein
MQLSPNGTGPENFLLNPISPPGNRARDAQRSSGRESLGRADRDRHQPRDAEQRQLCGGQPALLQQWRLWAAGCARINKLPALDQKTVAIIRSLDGTWHRPFTTLELEALQSLIEPEEHLLLDRMSDSVWREHIANLVPPDAACAIGDVMGSTLLLTASGETFVLGATPIWVRNVALALTMPGSPT